MTHLHVPTLLIVALVVNLTLGCFCFSCWYGRRDRQIYMWLSLGGAAVMSGCILLMMRGHASEVLTVWLAQSLVLLASGALWAGIQTFERCKPNALGIFGGVLCWTIFCMVPPLYAEITNRAICLSVIIAVYFTANARQLISGYRTEPSRGRLIASFLSIVHIIAAICRIVLISYVGNTDHLIEEGSNWIGIFVIESIVGIVGIVLALTTMERDRAEMEQRKAASTDVLTGALSRRAFLDAANDWIERNGKDAALILFDLDHFKKINDTYGHAGGDAALVGFARLVSERIQIANIIAGFNIDAATSNQYPRWYETTLADAAEGGEPIFGRLGGEEFACLLPHLSQKQGITIAEDIREGIAKLDVSMGGHPIAMSVSASVVSTADIGHRLDMMLSSADHALYRAKGKGRNRVEPGIAEPGMMIRTYA